MRILNILTRHCLTLDRFDDAVSFYEELFEQPARLRFDYPEHDLKLAQIASLLLIGGPQESLARFAATEATFLVDDIAGWEEQLRTLGAVILEPIKTVPTGRNMLVRHRDGMLVEYVEHRDKHPDDHL
ncbi:glyoxalase [Sphingomonas sp. Leaf357]|uniref:VOC family protein n=1 Tax=Sphingomonas sp. Leaf357 TaxID=1736350 RepID=UPI0006F33CC6|nr:glyoxalase/bleomycin resistance/dioxygenase family protein [Sphingomonas sp. Leaf357]KQS02205.1 glyoxalase [Sphingomonas sp. Leaf357]